MADSGSPGELKELREYEAIEKMLGNKKKLILSAPEAEAYRGRDIRDSPEFLRVLRQELTNYISLKQYKVMEDKYFQKMEDNKILLEKLHKMEKDIKWA